VFHPLLKAKDGGFGRIKLSDLEHANSISELMTKMVNRESGHMKLEVKAQYDNKKHFVIRDNHYYFTNISGTPFSLGIALPDGYAQTSVDGKRSLQDFDLSSLRAEIGHLTLAPWQYCQLEMEVDVELVEQLIQYLNGVQEGHITDYQKRCNDELIQSLLFDAEATRGVATSWIKENWDDTTNELTFVRNSGIEVVFLGTRSGLTRYLTLTDFDKKDNFVLQHSATINEAYYVAAVDNGEEIFTFALQSDSGQNGKTDLSTLLITASSPIMVTDDGRDAVVAVVGVQLRYTNFYDLFMNSTKPCSGSNNDILCHDLCQSEKIDCYLLDYNGFVVLSENPEELGKFFGELNGASSVLIKELVADNQHQSGSKFVFKRYEVHDHQALCEIWTKLKPNSASVFSRPFAQMSSFISWLLQEIALFVTHFSVFHWWLENNIVASDNASYVNSDYSDHLTRTGGRLEDYDFESALNELKRFVPESSWRMWIKEVTDMVRRDVSPQEIWIWLEEIMRQHLPHTVGTRPCTHKHIHYVADPMQLPQHGTLLSCDMCTKSYSINHVPRTNLMLLAVDSLCLCNSEPALSIEPTEVTDSSSDICQRLQKVTHRKAPAQCYPYHEKEEELGKCGRCSLHRLYVSALTFCLLFTSCLLELF
jgi:hypothetical protein